MIRIGIDVGGTNTDAVIMDGSQVIAGVKAGTTADVMTGVVAALRDVLATSGMDAGKVDVVMIGTTHFINAVVQGRSLNKVGALRIGALTDSGLEIFGEATLFETSFLTGLRQSGQASSGGRLTGRLSSKPFWQMRQPFSGSVVMYS